MIALVIIPVAFVGAVAWTSFAGRTRSLPSEEDAVAQFERLREALAAPLPHS